jgi:hypothetical protein
VRHRFLPALLGLAIGVLPLAPVEHVHKATGADGHDHVIVHTHTEAHHRSIDAHGHPDASLDDGDTVVLALNPVFAVPHSSIDFAPAVTQVRIVEEPQAATLDSSSFVERLIHGPPRAPTALRGPPVSSLL